MVRYLIVKILLRNAYHSLFILLCLVGISAFGQDTIVTSNYDVLPVKVLELNYSKNLVRFKRSSLLEGPVYTQYLTDLFLIKVANAEPIYNDPFENPYPGSKSVTPISMNRIPVLEYSAKDLTMSLWESEAALRKMKEADKVNEAECADYNLVRIREEHFQQIFETVLNATKQYCKSRNYGIVDDYEWDYVYFNCDSVVGNHCRLHQFDHARTDLNNAYSAGNGKLIFTEYFFTGISDDMIAGIIAHEIGHSIAQHSLIQNRRKENEEKAAFWISIAASVKLKTQYDVAKSTVDELTDVIAAKPYSRKLEAEADRIGAVLMALAGYDPHAIVEYWKTGDRAIHTHYKSTHPGGLERAYDIRMLINSTEFKLLTHKR
jgi:Zn-dependent protease with chaperone function